MRRKHDKQAIVAVGATMLRQQGFSPTGVDEVIKACQIPKGSFYNFFENKEDFALQSLRLYSTHLQEKMKSKLQDSSLSTTQKIISIYESVLESNAQEGYRYGCLINNLNAEHFPEEGKLATEIAELTHQTIDLLTQSLAEGQAKLEIRTDTPAEDLAMRLHCGMYGALSVMKIQRSGKPVQLFIASITELLSPR